MNFLKKLFVVTSIIIISGLLQQIEAKNLSGTDSLKVKDGDPTFEHIDSLYRYVKRNDLILKSLNPTKAINAPFGFYDEEDGIGYMVLIDNVKITNKVSTFDAYLMIGDPDTASKSQRFYFYGKNLSFYNSSIIPDSSIVYLLSDDTIELAHEKIILFGKDKKTYARFGCNGFEDLYISGKVLMDKDYILPESDSGVVDSAGVLESFFTLTVTNINDIIIETKMGRGRLVAEPHFSIEPSSVIIDMNEKENSKDLNFPDGYVSNYLKAPYKDDVTWQGIYYKNSKLYFPPEFADADGKRPEVDLDYFIIDESGLSFNLKATYLDTLLHGEFFGGWEYTIDKVNISWLNSKNFHFDFSGKLHMPYQNNNDTTELKYSCLYSEKGKKYNFNLELEDKQTITFAPLNAKLLLYPTSYIDLPIEGGHFKPKGVFSGELNISSTNSNSPAQLQGITFSNLIVQSVYPYITCSTFGINGSTNSATSSFISNFPITFSNLKLKPVDKYYSLSVDADINLNPKFSASGNFEILGDVEFKNKKIVSSFEGINIHKFKADIDQGAFKLKGELECYVKDTIYGSGFKGSFELSFDPGLSISGTGQFGAVLQDDNTKLRYFYVDALIKSSQGIPIGQTGLSVYGFGGGIYSHMSRSLVEIKWPEDEDVVVIDKTNSPGVSLSGTKYKPDANINLGLKATLVIGASVNPKAFNGDATFEIAFNNTWGVSSIMFRGNSYFMSDLNSDHKDASFKSTLELDYVFATQALNGTFESWLNIKDQFVGAGANHKLGTVLINFSSDKWFIYVGTPKDRLAAKLMKTVDVNAYFVMGSVIPHMPSLPAEITNISGASNLSAGRDLSAINNGKGFAFGASFSMKTPKLNYWKFYANFDISGGFDIMLRDYGTAHCTGETEPIGINGWYASGQAYAYTKGDIGLKFELFKKEMNMKILSIQAYAIIQAQLPNPMWMQGNVGGTYNILSGTIKGNCDFNFTIGEQCDMQSSILDGVDIIASLSPGNNTKDISVFSTPQAIFNLPIDKSFSVYFDGSYHSYKINLDHFTFKQNNIDVPGHIVWNENNTVAVYKWDDILESTKDYTLSVRLNFKEFKNGEWVSVKDYSEKKDYKFTTGERPNYIPENQISVSYPIKNQLNFYKDEYNQGFLNLRNDMNYLLASDSNYYSRVRFYTEPINGDPILTNFTYDSTQNVISFLMPPNMENSQIYKFEIVKIPINENVPIDNNVEVSNTQKTESNSDINIATSKAKTSSISYKEQILYSMYFRTSEYNNFTAKLNSFNIKTGGWYPITAGVFRVGTNLNGYEVFDKFEMDGQNEGDAGRNFEPCVQLEAVPSDQWLSEQIVPLMYQNYPFANQIYLTNRDITTLGVPPYKDVYFSQSQKLKQLTENDIETGFPGYSYSWNVLNYDLSISTYNDFYNLRNQAANSALSNNNSAIINLLNTSFPSILAKDYLIKTKVKYIIPGRNINTTSKIIDILD